MSPLGSNNGRSVDLPDHVRRLYGGLKQVGATRPMSRADCISLGRTWPCVRLHRAHRLLRQIVERRLSEAPSQARSVNRPCRSRATTRVFNSDAVVDLLSLHAECDVADVPYGQFEMTGGFAAGLEDESVFLLVGKSFLFEERDS